MKSLDEVIDIFEAYSKCRYDLYEGPGQQTVTDALHYLKHLQEYYEMSREHHDPNPPLTWEELRKMRVQPVWFEVLDHQSLPLLDSWTITTGTPYKSWQGVESMAFIRPGASYSVPVADYGRTWITYRKERI